MRLGTLFQPWDAEVCNSPAEWRAWMSDLRGTGVSRLIVQFVVWEDQWVLVSEPGEQGGAKEQKLSQILEAAHGQGIQVWLGLWGSETWWSAIDTKRSDAEVAQYLTSRIPKMAALAQALVPAMRHEAVVGWYVSDEIDDINWVTPQRQAMLEAWLKQVTEDLHALVKKPIAISGFADGLRTHAADCQAQWQRWLRAAPLIDEVLLQDGIGACHNRLPGTPGPQPQATWPELLEAVDQAAQAHQRRCTPVVELMVTEDCTVQHPKMHPAPVDRVAAQFALARAVHAEVMTFSVPHYATRPKEPEDRDAADRLKTWLIEQAKGVATPSSPACGPG